MERGCISIKSLGALTWPIEIERIDLQFLINKLKILLVKTIRYRYFGEGFVALRLNGACAISDLPGLIDYESIGKF